MVVMRKAFAWAFELAGCRRCKSYRSGRVLCDSNTTHSVGRRSTEFLHYHNNQNPACRCNVMYESRRNQCNVLRWLLPLVAAPCALALTSQTITGFSPATP